MSRQPVGHAWAFRDCQTAAPAASPLLVVYDRGAAGPGELFRSLRSVAPIHFLAARNEYVTGMLPLLEELAPVHLASDDVTQLTDECAKLSPAGVVTFSEQSVRATAALAASLGLPHNSVDTAESLTNKSMQRERLRAAGVGGVRFARLDTVADWHEAAAYTGLPLVIKPRVGEGSRNTFLVTDPHEGFGLARRLLEGPERDHGLVVEEFLQGRDMSPFGDFVSVESAAQFGEIRHLAVTGKFPLLPPFRERGQFWPPALDPLEAAEITSLVTSALLAVGFTFGLAHTEVKLTAEGPRIIEINGRLGGFINDLARRSSGLDLVELAGRIAMGERVRPQAALPESVFFQFHNLAPLGERELVAIRGRARVRRMADVDAYHVLAPTPRILDGGVHTQELDMICGHAATHEEMFSVISEVCEALTFEFSSGEVTEPIPAWVPSPHPQ